MLDKEIKTLLYSSNPNDKEKLVKNQKALKKVANETFRYWLSPDSFQLITDAIGYVANEKVLSKIALKSSWEEHRRAAIKNPHLKDENVLTEVALKPGSGINKEINKRDLKENWVNKFLAMEKISDDKLLEKIARREKNDKLMACALKKISSEKILKDIALNYESPSLRVAAIEEINDQRVFQEILSKAQPTSVIVAAVKKLTDQDMLKRGVLRALELPEAEFRTRYSIEAIKNITDEDFLIFMAQSSDKYQIRIAAIGNPNLKDEEILMDFAKYDESHEVRMVALNMLDNQEMFIDLAFHDADSRVREYAASRINSKNVLRELMKNYGIGHERFEEISKMNRYKQLQLIKDEK